MGTLNDHECNYSVVLIPALTFISKTIVTSDSIIIITMHNASADTSTATITMLPLCIVLASGAPSVTLYDITSMIFSLINL